ncbi:hypothetical protein [Streptomyces sp. CS014]|uniref:hypothetical protein n=1 Tax=Streptomyces sp. CS014 TaxID=2162707 RepID=UPI0013A59F44|nr:hypothetical protein [Streptomyces sp. CS014]
MPRRRKKTRPHVKRRQNAQAKKQGKRPGNWRRKLWRTSPLWVPVLGALVYWGVRTALEVLRYRNGL